MPKLTVSIVGAVVLAILHIAPAFSAGFELNPDRFPSIGFSLGLQGLAGESSVKGAGVRDQDVGFGEFDLTVDSVIPVSNSLSLFGNVSLIGQSATAEENADFFETETNLAGIGIRLGARIYMNR